MTQTLEQLSAAATEGEWSYRPLEHDDWGIVRGEEIDLWEWKSRPIIAQFRGRQDEKELSEHRLNKTDPWGADAKFVVALVNLYRTGQIVAVSDDAMVEWVANAISSADLDGPEPEEYWKSLALAAIAAMKDTQL